MNAHAVNRGELPVLTAKDRDFFFMKRKTPEAVVQTERERAEKAKALVENLEASLKNLG